MKKRARPRRGSEGFSIIEALVAAAILGVALIGIVRLHGSSIRGTSQAERIGRASEVARQVAEMLATTTAEDLPACLPGLNLPPPDEPAGCKEPGVTTVATDEKDGIGCTFYVQGGPSTPSIEDPESVNGAIVSTPDPGPTGWQPSQYRVDITVSQHPDAGNFPDTALLTVYVCWLNEIRQINEVRTRRILYVD